MRQRRETRILLGLLLGLATAGVAGEGTPADDDLAVVKKAVATEPNFPNSLSSLSVPTNILIATISTPRRKAFSTVVIKSIFSR